MDMIVVPALRELACVLLLGRFRAHTSDTLGLLQQHIAKFGEYSQVCIFFGHSLYKPTMIQILRTTDDFLGDNRVTFLWPKMHSVTHLVESIRGKGVAANTSTDGGEALHPQTRKFWQRSNHQPDTAEDQVFPFFLLITSCYTDIGSLRCFGWHMKRRSSSTSVIELRCTNKKIYSTATSPMIQMVQW